MPTMRDAEPPIADRLRAHPAPTESDLSLVTENQAGAPRCTDGTFSVRLLAAQGADQDTAVLSVHGEVDLGTGPALREVLLPVLEDQAGPVVVDLSEVAFMDSTGVHLLVETFQRLSPQNRRFALVCRDGGQVHRLLALVGLLDVLTVHRSRDAAVIGGDGRLRPEPGRNSQQRDPPALTQHLLSARQTTEC